LRRVLFTFLKPFTSRYISLSFETCHIVYHYTCKRVVTRFLNTVGAISDPVFCEVCNVYIYLHKIFVWCVH
jgi:hypothetical protein